MQTSMLKKNVCYKCISFSKNVGTMASILANAVKGDFTTPAKREEKIDDTTRRLLNRFHISDNLFLAELVRYDSGKTPQTLETVNKQGYFPIEALTELPLNKQLVETSAYICVLNKHMLILASQGFNIATVEAYLSWLLNKIQGDDAGFSLLDLPSKELSELASKDDFVTEVVIGNNLSFSNTKKKSISLYNNSASGLLQALKKNFQRSILPEDIEEWSKIAVYLTIKYSRPKNQAEFRPDLINLLGSVSAVPEEKLKIKTKKGKTLTGNQIRLKFPMQVATINGNIDLSRLFSTMKQEIKKAVTITKQ